MDGRVLNQIVKTREMIDIVIEHADEDDGVLKQTLVETFEALTRVLKMTGWLE